MNIQRYRYSREVRRYREMDKHMFGFWTLKDLQITGFVPEGVQYLPCMSIIPGEELFSGVVSSEPYFSSLPFFLFLFFYNEKKKYRVQTHDKSNQHLIT